MRSQPPSKVSISRTPGAISAGVAVTNVLPVPKAESGDAPTLWDDDEPTWSISELGEALVVALRRSFPDEVWVRGEIRNLSRGRAHGRRHRGPDQGPHRLLGAGRAAAAADVRHRPGVHARAPGRRPRPAR